MVVLEGNRPPKNRTACVLGNPEAQTKVHRSTLKSPRRFAYTETQEVN